MRRILLSGLITWQCALAAHAQVAQGIGIVSTVVNTANRLAGSVTFTPQFAVEYYTLRDYGQYGNNPYNSSWRITRNDTFGTYSYTFTAAQPDGTTFTSHDSSMFSSIGDPPQRWNYKCDLSSTNPDGTVNTYVYNTVEDFTVGCWSGPVTYSGLFSPGAPWTVWFKSYATSLAESCASITPVTGPVRNSVAIGPTGVSTFKFGSISDSYSWPPQAWAGGMWDH